MTDIDVNDKIMLIKQTDLDDAMILSGNYKVLANSTDDPKEQQNFVILRTTAKLRIKELTEK